jgi:xanthine dehydrogenase YagR molybdenum-binding subunit
MTQPLIGKPLDRVDGPVKVTGAAKFTADHAFDGMLHAVVVTSTIAKGRVLSIDATQARAAGGIVDVMTHENAPRVHPEKAMEHHSIMFLLQRDVVEFDGQPVAVVIGETFERATHAAHLVRVRYEEQPPHTDLLTGKLYVPEEVFGAAATATRGEPQAAYASAPVKLTNVYTTPTEHHNPIETHATIAHWEGDRLTLHDATQWTFGVRRRLAPVLGIPPEHIRVIAPFVGGAFGSKGQPWSHVALAAMAAKLVGKPVKLVVTRPQMFAWIGHRPQTHQTIAIGATQDGRLQSLTHDTVAETSIEDEFVEACGLFGRDLYAVPNFGMAHALRRINISKPTYQRAPGESTGSVALEIAMDELACELGVDPLELRLRNYAENDPGSGRPYSSKRLRDCYARAAERFSWSARDPRPRSMRDGRTLIGYGMATASHGTFRSEAHVRVRMTPGGIVTFACGTIEQGTGSSTVFAQLGAELLDLPFERVRFEWGSTDLPYAPLAAGSQTAAAVGSAIVAGATGLRARLTQLGGNIPPGGIDFEVQEDATEAEDRYAQQAFGAHFVEVRVDPDLGTVRVARVVSAFDAARILNAKTARSQHIGGIVWGISMALFEKTRYDLRTARIMNANLADYLVPTNADIPPIDVIMIESDDPHINPAHVKGIGEVSITGCAAAIVNAVYHATGIRIRDLPITPESLLVSS